MSILDDPTIPLISYYDSFSFPIEAWKSVHFISYVNIHHTKLTSAKERKKNKELYCDEEWYNILTRIKSKYDHSDFYKARKICNPFEYLSNSIFMNRAAIKLANIDSVIKLPKVDTFCDVAAGPGGFTQYIQFRYPNAVGFGMTLKTQDDDWNVKLLDMKRFTTIYGPKKDDNGDLYVHWNFFVNQVKSKYPEGVDLVTADGGFQTEFDEQEISTSRLLLVQSLIGVSCCKKGGYFVLKIFDTVTHFSVQLIYCLSTYFEEIIVFKPLSSRPANSERYLICKSRNDNSDTQLLIDKSALDNPLLLFEEELPSDFINWIIDRNHTSILRQIAVGKCIISNLYKNNKSILQELEIEDFDNQYTNWVEKKYNLEKAFLLWNLPTIRDEHSKIVVE